MRPLSPEAARVAMTALSDRNDPLRRHDLAGLTVPPGQRLDLGQAGSLEIAVVDAKTPGPLFR